MAIELLDLLIALANNAASISQLIKTAQSENRDITPAEMQSILDNDAVARAGLVAAIATAKAKGL